MLRLTVIQDIISPVKNNKFFIEEDFVIDQQVKDGQICVNIHYKYDNSLYFNMVVSIDFSNKASAIAQVSPGIIIKTQSIAIKELSDAKYQLSNWLIRLEEEMKLMPLERKVFEHEDKIRKWEEVFEEVPDKYFTKQEAENLIERLEKLEKELHQKIENTVDPNLNIESELDKIHSDMSSLKEQIQILSRKNWMSSFLARALNWANRNPGTIRGIVEGTKGLLPDEVSSKIPNEIVELLVPEEN
ncbi:hypothetical protein JJB07_14075 [Tumebacillus sp. ITR2]|uniref:Uncharacterized protein n=1 Tax=Tumebacillus amylolyticus TaxID=2801339 RepID=A0ABS1JBZ1_9BACL|nr:hypothetical protein [Tumebacillus amylolyticus]MBL0387764.1 hypothetical protein [Tumebacillus amylolyticus]